MSVIPLYLRGLLATMTVMTLITVICRGSLKGWRLCLPSEMDLLNSSVTSERHVFYRLLGR
jgi:hypothetical protein